MSWTKKALYQQRERLRRRNSYFDIYPLDMVATIQAISKYITVEISPFTKRSLCGMLLRDDEYSTIMLNEARTSTQRNYDCAHELIHYFYHPDAGSVIVCDDTAPTLDSYIEWQANEGASELLMPYRQFIPRIAQLVRNDGPVTHCPGQYERTRDYFGVTDAMMEIRLKSLRYEIWQYLKGTSIEDVDILSDTRQKEIGIVLLDYSFIDMKPAVRVPVIPSEMITRIIEYFKKRKRFEGIDRAVRYTNERFDMKLSKAQYKLLLSK